MEIARSRNDSIGVPTEHTEHTDKEAYQTTTMGPHFTKRLRFVLRETKLHSLPFPCVRCVPWAILHGSGSAGNIFWPGAERIRALSRRWFAELYPLKLKLAPGAPVWFLNHPSVE